MQDVGEQTDLSGYTVTLSQATMMGMWTWEIETPDGNTLTSLLAFIDKSNAKKDALKVIERHHADETMDGNALRDSLNP